MRVYVEGLGYRDSLKDFEQIIWFLNQVAKTLSAKAKTKYFLDFKERWFERLYEAQAFELLDFISKNVTDMQEKNRVYYLKRQKRIAKLEMEFLADEMERRRTMYKLTSNYCLN